MTLILFVISIILIFIGIVYTILKNVKKDSGKPKKSIAAVLVVGGIILLVFSQSFTIIPTGYSGVKTTFGQISQTTAQSGFNWKIPFVQNVDKVNNKQQDITFENEVWGETNKRTSISYSNVTVTYQINPSKSAWIYANVSNFKDDLVSQGIVSSAIKSASKNLSDEKATNRSLVEPKVSENIQSSLDEKYGTDTVIINKTVIGNADFEESYNKAIAKKQKAQLEAEEQEIKNKKAIAKAKADAEVKKTKAEAEALANETINKSLSDKNLKQQFIEKWDGKLPTYMSSDEDSVLFGLK